jgi:hypothetical protein
MTARPHRRRTHASIVLAAALVCLGPAGGSASAAPAGSGGFSDVPGGYWAGQAIRAVAIDHRWMRDFGSTTFRPEFLETRRRFARAVVRAFAPKVAPDPGITFGDMSSSDPFYRYANVAVKLGWMRESGHQHLFRPTADVTTLIVHRALVLALGLRDVVRGINAIHTSDGYRFAHRPGLGSLLTGMLLGFRYNHADASLDVGPHTRLRRSEVAWSLYHAYLADTSESWRMSALVPYGTIHLGPVSSAMRRVVEFGLRNIAFPYVYAGEWNTRSPSGYCCGYQPRGGFDCSGLMWWVLKAPQSGYDNTRVRPYRGWALPERSSEDMSAAMTRRQRVPYDHLRAGDLMLYDPGGNGVIDHVDLYLGRGWALDSSSSAGGVIIVPVRSGWYRDHFKWGRDIMRASA